MVKVTDGHKRIIAYKTITQTGTRLISLPILTASDETLFSEKKNIRIYPTKGNLPFSLSSLGLSNFSHYQ